MHEEDLHSEVVHEEDEILCYIQNPAHCSDTLAMLCHRIMPHKRPPLSRVSGADTFALTELESVVATVRLICDGCHYQQSMRSVPDSGDHSAGPVSSHHALDLPVSADWPGIDRYRCSD